MDTDSESDYPEYQDNFVPNSFVPFTELQTPDPPEDEIVHNEVKSHLSSLMEFLPTIDLNLFTSSYIRHKAMYLIRTLLSSAYLDKQQRPVLEKIVLHYSITSPHPKFSKIISRHVFAFLFIFAASFFSTYLFTLLVILALSKTFFHLKIINIFSFILIHSTFSKVLKDITHLEDILKELSKALKLQKQIQIVQRTFFRDHAKSLSQYNYTHLINLKLNMTNLYLEIFTSLKNKSDYFSMQSMTFRRDEMICTLRIEDILYQIYKETRDNILDLTVTNMTLDSFKMWDCLITCQYSEYIEILVRIMHQHLLIQNSPAKQLNLIQILRSHRLLQDSQYEDGYLSLLVYLTKSDVFNCDLDMKNLRNTNLSNKQSDTFDNFDKIDLILQCCILKLRNLKDPYLRDSDSENEIKCLKLNLENAIDGLKNLSSSTCIDTSMQTAFSEYQGENRLDSTENELIIAKPNTLEVPESAEVVYEGVSLDRSDLRKDLFREKEGFIDTASTQTVLKELKCVLANKKANLKSGRESTDKTSDFILDSLQEHLDESLSESDFGTSALSSTRICESLDLEGSPQNLINSAVLEVGRRGQIKQTVIGDYSDSD